MIDSAPEWLSCPARQVNDEREVGVHRIIVAQIRQTTSCCTSSSTSSLTRVR